MEFIVVIGIVQSYLAKWGERLNFGNGIAEIARKSTLNFGNFITEILVLPVLPAQWKPIVTMALPKMEKKKKKKKRKELWQLSCRKRRKKKDATSTTFFTTNYRWLVVIGSNLNLTLRLLFCPNNNNQ